MITANKFMRANYGAALRSYLVDEVKLERLVDFGDLPVFGDATTYPIIIISAKVDRAAQPIEYALMKTLEPDNLDAAVRATANKMPESAFSGSNWSLVSNSKQAILDKLQACSTPLLKVIDSKIQYGLKTGFNQAFVIDEATRDKLIAEDASSVEIIKPFLVGEDINRYTINFQDRYLIWTYIGVPIGKYQAIYKHLQQYQQQLEKRWDKGNYWWELRHCDYYPDFEKPKIIFPDIANGCQFAYSIDGDFSINTTYFMASNNIFLLAVLNSSLIEFFYRSKTAIYRGGYLRFFTQYVNETPIRRIAFTTSQELRTVYLDEARQLYSQYIADNNELLLLRFVKHHLTQQPEASDVVHDLLAYLAERMLGLNKDKSSLQSAFLTYLEAKLEMQPHPDKNSGKSGLEVLKGKDRLLNYPRDYQKDEKALSFQEVVNILLENRRHFRQYPDNRLIREIEGEYESNVEAIEKIKRQLKLTVILINSVVYKLYELNEDEVKMIEGKN